MAKHTLPFIALVVTVATGCSYINNNNDDNGGGETGGIDQWSEGPVEIENPPEWVCRERAPNVTLAGYEQPIPELERCYYTPHYRDYNGDGMEADPWGWPGKPHWRDIPNVMSWLEEINPMALSHPIYTWDDPNDMLVDGYVLHEASPSAPWLPHNEAEFRSGLIGNFALWIGGVPDQGHRPPIVTASFIDVANPDIPTILGHPFYEGRYNAYGVPCSTNLRDDSSLGGVGWPMLLAPFKHSPNAECQAWVEYYGVAAAYPYYSMIGLEPTMIGVAQEHAKCLDNGGVYKVSEAALTAADRNGLIWINWGEFWEDFVLWIQQTHPEIHALLVALDQLQDTGWNAWPIDPPYPYNNWSVTGVCAHPAQLAAVNGSIRTTIPCPEGMIAVFAEFEPEEVVEDDLAVDGYCTFAILLPPPPGAADLTPIDIISTGRRGHGFTGAKYVNLRRLTRERLDAWIASIRMTPTPDGVEVSPVSDLGRDLLAAFDVPAGSRIIGLNQLMLRDNPCDEIVAATLTEAALEIDRAVRAHEFFVLLIDTPTGRRLHRYIAPYVGER